MRLRKYIGFSLIEFMLALMLGSLLLMSLLELYLAMQRSAQTQHDLLVIEGRARQTFVLFEQMIKSAGNIGCAKLSRQFHPVTYKSINLTPQAKISGAADSVTVTYAGYPVSQLQHINSSKQEILIDKNTVFKRGNIIVIADCNHVEINEINHVIVKKDVQQIKLNRALQYDYSREAEVARLEHQQLRLERQSLVLVDLQQRHHQLVAGVKQLSFKYMLKQHDDLHLVTADQVRDWSSVQGVLLDLILSIGGMTRHYYDFVKLAVT